MTHVVFAQVILPHPAHHVISWHVNFLRLHDELVGGEQITHPKHHECPQHHQTHSYQHAHHFGMALSSITQPVLEQLPQGVQPNSCQADQRKTTKN